MNMETERICPNCGKPLLPDVPLGLCPECLIKSGFPTGTEPGAGGIGRFVPPPVEEIARLFPQFEILGFIGKGGMGAVYRARQPALDRLVALKVLPPAVGSDPGFAERFTREARALARLNHPNIVAVYDFGKTGELHYLVLEFVDGTNLREVERSGRLSPEQALAIVPQICDALQFAHNEGVVHRDIKPENLLLDKKGRVKITDFGIAKILDVRTGKVCLTGARDVVGTPHYMAPEQIEKPQTVDHRADIYSLGVVFYEMLTGELPLGNFAPPSRKAPMDARLDEVVLHTLEKEPERRYQQASQVKTDVETIGGTPPAARGAAAAAGATPPREPASSVEAVSDKILLPTFLLAFFFGGFGAHRFYVGKTVTGILQLCALGSFCIWMTVTDYESRALGCFILAGLFVWVTIDWILILCKAFTDGKGRRITNWWHASAAPPNPAKPPGVRAGFSSSPSAPPAHNWLKTLGGVVVTVLIVFLIAALSGFLHHYRRGAITFLMPDAANEQNGDPAESSPPAIPSPPAASAKPTSTEAASDHAKTTLQPPPPPAHFATPPLPEAPPILLESLRTAQMRLTNMEAQYKTGNASSADLDTARGVVRILQSVLATETNQAFDAARNEILNAQQQLEMETNLMAQQAKMGADLSNSLAQTFSRTALVVRPGEKTSTFTPFVVGFGGRLEMNVDRGDVHITGTDGSVVSIRLTRQVTGESDTEAAQILNDERVVLKQDGNEISITAENPPELQHTSFFNHPNLDAHYEITLPRQFEAHVETSGGEINVSDIQGSINLKTAGGRIVCNKITGDVNAHTIGGDVQATECKGRLDLETMGGSIAIDGFAGPSVHATTAGGSVSANFDAAPTEDSELKTSGGNITVQLPDNAALQLEGQTFAGSEKSDFPVEIQDQFGNGTLSGAINGGGPAFQMSTSAGNVEVRKK
jgi:DUF4097 and DUF4098 domain-containing protein YvlB